MRRQLWTFLVNTTAFYLAAQVLPIHAATPWTYLWAGFVLTLVNFFLRPLLILLTFPLNLLTVGLFTLVVNTWMLMLTAVFLPGLVIPGFGVAFLAALLISLVNWLAKTLRLLR
ncbi:Mycobacterial 4 TMS phage holin, superfamily IV [Acididesulfobacillus acetoxydans]|uniref:Mycobacterial 4 TMS phage holin, superfamily IV n=1 Tax=Acididesulfobacillus acetoxydans TaxID=1561005 RepID=A0A8S0WEE8_9FIRM|nr:phage holin family protein [Acididesulfobacillus acetoxydans]CAA7600052.1 Mycobacterial 4 TMS phage holin, superfamily IV [Acididesulfobacillus acetoxydans]CEJ07827.1 Membrane protein of unknown function [Acididesulfobacillus acetoxydans]